VVSQVRVAANENAINWADLHWERSYHARRAYSQSKIAFGLFGLELARRGRALGWGITSDLSHPGVAPTSLLAARPELGRPNDTMGVRLIRALSRVGVLGTVASASLPALLAATSPDARGGRLFGPSRFRNLSGPPAEQRLWSRLTDEDEAARVWQVSTELTGASFPGGAAPTQPATS
jgi:hypothetical protein